MTGLDRKCADQYWGVLSSPPSHEGRIDDDSPRQAKRGNQEPAILVELTREPHVAGDEAHLFSLAEFVLQGVSCRLLRKDESTG